MTLSHKSIGLNLILLLLFVSCEQIVKVDPPHNQLISQTVFDSETAAVSAINGLYSKMMQGNAQFGSSAITLLAGLSADEFYNATPGIYSEFADNAIASSNTVVRTNIWSQAYNLIYQANSIIEGVDRSSHLSSEVRNQLTGEGLFIRAFCHFYLVNLFGDIPLITTTNYLDNLSKPRSRKEDVYRQIENDLELSKTLLNNNYPQAERIRPNKWVATALLSRVYLYTNKLEQAVANASEVLARSEYSLEISPANVFKRTSQEAIWQMAPVQPGNNTWEGILFIPFDNTIPTYPLRTGLSNDFELHDARKIFWIDSKVINGVRYDFPAKYKIRASSTVTEYYVVFRLAEQYLIRAEGFIRQGKITEGISDLNILRTRASNGSGNTLKPIEQSLSQEQALNVVLKERRIELFAEWGHRWFDLRRWGIADAIIKAQKNNDIKPSDLFFPIPSTEILRNPKLIQNEGY